MKKTKYPWSFLDYWTTGEWQVVEERLRDIRKKRLAYCPGPDNLFAALKRTSLEDVRVVIVGQDPYPNLFHATGVAFEIPADIPPEKFPQTLKNIFKEYQDDLHLPAPACGDLSAWSKQGVLLWNAFPSCDPGNPGSHNWEEWSFLTKEIVERTTAKGVVIVFLGNKARDFVKYVDNVQSEVILTSHPSPRGSLKSDTPFLGSRIFSTINDKLASGWGGTAVIDWRL